ncbi:MULTISPECIES: hypothetical protein [unclassified Tepidimonas]|jgi:hypothetical protein|uniref:hypothetical protein n=1 Tax=unclassified Tepidimonas TaxID=2631705 RepID=UPI003C7EB3FE
MGATAGEMSWEEIKALFRETDRRFRESDRKFQETERLLKERSEETDRKFQETRELLDRLSRRFGDLGNRLGEFVEAMVEPALVDLFRARGLDVSEVHRRVTSRRGGEAIEIDLLVVDGDTAVAVECKSRLTKEEVERHVERMNKFKRLLPKYADMRIHGAVAGMVVDEDAVEAAQTAGLWVLAQSGETVALRNAPDFSPRVW